MHTDGENVDALFSLCAHAVVEDARFRKRVQVLHDSDQRDDDAVFRLELGIDEPWIEPARLVLVEPADRAELRIAAEPANAGKRGVVEKAL
jgi:hypothetical protein